MRPVTAQQPEGNNPLLYARMVGGSSITSRPISAFHESIFTSATCSRGIPGTAFADWPIQLSGIEPYYTKDGMGVGVSGLAYASPFDPPRTNPIHATVAVKILRVLFERGAAANSGCIPFRSHGIASGAVARPGCAALRICMGFGCEVMAKSRRCIR